MKRFAFFICLGLLYLLVTAGIPVVTAGPTVNGISPVSGPTGSDITVTVTGSGFSTASSVYLYKCALVSGSPGSQRKFPGSIQSVTSNKIVATFSLDSSYKVGNYGVIVSTPEDGFDYSGYKENIFTVYKASGSTTTTTTTEATPEATTKEPSPEGENSIFFETNPSGATIYLDGEEVGTSTFTYHTDMDGSHRVVVRKIGYEDYEDRINIAAGGQRTRFYAQLTPLSSTSGTVTKTTGTSSATGTGKPVKTATTIKKSSIKIPTPLGTVPPAPEESPADPVTVLWAVAFGIMVVVFRRR
jgi:hypothetical protein